MIFWVKASSTPEQPNDQRARLIEVIDGRMLRMEMQGNGRIVEVSPHHLCGVEFGSNPTTALRFEVTSVQHRS